jgi:hypothetical protein
MPDGGCTNARPREAPTGRDPTLGNHENVEMARVFGAGLASTHE